ncbi:MAG: efflux RND transporter periplasmic adaptor subunit [Candidatus Acidiferrales bacterium]
MMRRATYLSIAALALAVAGCSDSSRGPDSTAAAPAPAASVPARPAAPSTAHRTSEQGDVLSVLSVEHQVDLSTERDGVVVSLAKDEGSSVKAGEILGQLDDRSLQMELAKARNDLTVAENNVKFKEAELKAKGAALKRQQQLRAYGLSSEADLEAAEFEAKGAEYDMHGWQALVESSHSEIHRLEIQLDQTRLRAPFSGVVVRRYVREGQAVGKNDKCFRVSQLSPLQVQFQVPESSSKRPERGAPVDLSLVGDSSRSLFARVVKVSPTVDPASDSYDVTAQLVGPGISDLRPGMAVHVVWPGTARAKP